MLIYEGSQQARKAFELQYIKQLMLYTVTQSGRYLERVDYV
jgi:hypothetical protein